MFFILFTHCFRFIGCLIILFASLFVVIQRNSISPGTAGLSISYALTLTQALQW